MLNTPVLACAKDVRLALWHVAMTREGPGLLYSDIEKGSEDVAHIIRALSETSADIIVLTKFDYDADGLALAALAGQLDAGQTPYWHLLPLAGNAGIPAEHDLDGNGRLRGRKDLQSYGAFPGARALAVLSRYPIEKRSVRSFNDVLWKDFPGTSLSPDDPGWSVQRLSSGGHWVVPVRVGGYVLSLLIGHSNTPVFDGPEDRNGRRNRDELRLWEQIIDPSNDEGVRDPFVFMANFNLDPLAGEGRRSAMQEFLGHPRLQDPLPDQPTALWENIGDLRVSYVLPSADITVRDAELRHVNGEPHRLIVVDISLPETRSP